jgi:hypothetical protein
MKTKDMPHGIVAFKFATALLEGKYENARSMLNANLRLEYPVSLLQSTFEKMMSLASELPEFPPVMVMDNSEIELPHQSMDEKGWVYVAIWTEAVTVTVKPFGQMYLITELTWGRP